MVHEDEGEKPVQGGQDFHDLDDDFIRVLEDVIDVLLTNGTLRLTDLPPQAQEKLNQRKKQRARLRNSLDFFPDDDALL
jgi:hypothetical protein